MTVVFLLAGTTSFPNPGNWNPTNTVEIVGSGAPTFRYRSGPPCPVNYAGYGGGGGGYGRGANRTDAFPVALRIPNGTLQGVGSSYYCNWVDPSGGGTGASSTPGAVYAGCSPGYGSGGLPGVAGGPTAGYAGAAGGTGGGGSTYYGAGGGGAGGPHGAGSAGSNSATGATVGGPADAGHTPGGTGPGAAGNNGTQWDPSHGCGSGGAGGSPNTGAGGVGGQYGGGAGGPGNTNTNVYNGGDALIVVTYTPFIPPAGANVLIMA